MCLYMTIYIIYIKMHLYDDIHHRFKDDRMMIYIIQMRRMYWNHQPVVLCLVGYF
jgi:hypothetical protein